MLKNVGQAADCGLSLYSLVLWLCRETLEAAHNLSSHYKSVMVICTFVHLP